jgi:hypothetical protein
MRQEGMARMNSSLSTALDNGYLSLKTLADYSGLSVRTLRSYFTHPSYPLPCYRIGRRVLVRRSDFDAWAIQFRVVQSPVDVGALLEDVVSGLR